MRPDIDALLDRGFNRMAAGQLADAEQAFLAAAAASPREHRARHALAIVALRAERPQHAVEHARSAVAIDRRNAEYLHTLGIALGESGDAAGAVEAFRRALRERANYPDAHCNLGLALRRLGQFDEAERALRRAIAFEPGSVRAQVELAKLHLVRGAHEAALPPLAAALALDPDSAAAHNALGIAYQGLGRLDEAAAAFRRAQASAPGDPDPHNNLGLILRRLGRHEESEASFRRAVTLDPYDAVAANNLGLALATLGRHDEAAECLRAVLRAYPRLAEANANLGFVLRRQGLLDEAASAIGVALEVAPGSAEFLNDLGSVRQAQDRATEAIALFERALAAEPANANALGNLGLALLSEGRVGAAIERLTRSVELQPDSAGAHNNLATAYRVLGDLPRAVEAYRRALALDPGAVDARSNLLAALNYLPDMSIADILAEHRRYGAAIEAPQRARWPAHRNARDPDRRLRVGYVSADFRAHAMAFSLAPVLAGHDPEAVEVVCYSTHPHADEVTAHLRRSAHEWQGVAALDDESMARMVEHRGIDLLIDLGGHTALNRLGVFARKPAPVQAAWLGYVTTTGLTAIDYRLTDAIADPPGGDESGFSETLVRLPWVSVFRPADESPAVAPLPSRGADAFTFGCLNHLSKLTPAVIALWAQILAAVPSSRLLLGNAGDPAVRDRIAAAFGTHGIGAARLDFRPQLPLREYLALHAEIDLALDPFPYNGGATSCHSLWMGVPFVTLAGDRYMARIGASLLHQVGLAELVATSPVRYVDLAAGLAGDRARLAGLREGLRPRLAASPLLDGAGFVRSLEGAYRTMWQAWCRRAEVT